MATPTTEIYKEMKNLANDVRKKYMLDGARVMVSDLKKIYKDQGITVVYWPYKLRKLRGCYINDEMGITVMIAKDLPDDPKAFTLAHELKHHFVDQKSCSTVDNDAEVREVAAEVFAAELLFPESLFMEYMTKQGLARYDSMDADAVQLAILHIKRNTKTTLSYLGLAKRAERLGYTNKGDLIGVHWKKLEESVFGLPIYKRRFVRSR